MRERLEIITAPTISNVEAEAVLLGGLMLANNLIDRAAEIVTPEDFAEPFFGRIYAALLREHDLGHQANAITLLPYFEDDPALAEVGGRGFLISLGGNIATLVGPLDMARQVAELATRRRLADRLTFLARAAEDYAVSVDQLATDTESAVADALRAGDGAASLAGSACIEQALAAMPMDDERAPGVTCGIIPGLDRALGPIRPGHLVILAGRPGMGKTATAISYAHGAAEQGFGVDLISLEMQAEDLGGRLACDIAFSLPGPSVPYARMTDGGASREERRQIARASLLSNEWPLWVEDLPSATISRLASVIRRQARRFIAKGQSLSLVIIDYLQLCRPNDREKDLYQAISAVSRGLKALAKSEGVGIMALCQLSRSVEQRADKRPRTDDLRDSGQIEQDADAICFLLRREEYLLREQPRDDGGAEWGEWHEAFGQARGEIEFIVPKRRFGRPGSATGQWHGEFQAVR